MHSRERMLLVAEVSQPSGWRGCLLVTWLAILLSACSPSGQYADEPGISYLAPPGRPPIQSVVWSPVSSDRLLVIANDMDYHDVEAYVLDIRTKQRKDVATLTSGTLRGYSWSPDGKSVLLMKATGIPGRTNELLVIGVDDGAMQLIAENVGSASWSPTGRLIAFFSYGSEATDGSRMMVLHVRNLITGEDDVVFSAESRGELGLSWSPDSSKIAFALGDLQSSRLWVIDLNSKDTLPITQGGRDSNPAWSPHRDAIAFQRYSADGRKSEILLVRQNGDCEVGFPDLDYVWSPTWLPDGDTLAFVGLDGLYTADLKTVLNTSKEALPCWPEYAK